jgi:hypothetical protein
VRRELAGIVTVTRLSRIPVQSGQRGIRAADPAAILLSRDPLGGEVMAIVEEGALIIGLVTAESMRQAIRWRKLAGTTRSRVVSP